MEECKKDFVKGPKALEREAKIASAMKSTVEKFNDVTQALAQITVPAEWVQSSHSEELTFLVGKADKKGKIHVTAVVPAFSKGMANWAKKQTALFLADKQEQAKKKAKTDRKDNSIILASRRAKKINPPTETVGELMAA